jgi:putative ABC transport system permease protein
MSAVIRSRVAVGGLVAEAVAGILERPVRTLLTVLGVLLGVGAFVAVLGLTTTASGQISKRFTELTATEVLLEDASEDDPAAAGTAFPLDAETRVAAIDGVRSAGVFWPVPASRIGTVTAVPLPGAVSADRIQVVAASPGLFPAVRAHLRQGRAFDTALDGRRERVAVVGQAIAEQLRLAQLQVRPTLSVNGVAFTVIGVVDAVQRRTELLSSVWVPRQTAEQLWPGPPDSAQPARMVIDTRLGAADVVAAQAPFALRAEAPQRFRTFAPPDPRQLRDTVRSDLSTLFLILAGICLIAGAVGIANTTMVAVLERTAEIGLRRSLGAQKRHIAAQFLSESAALGTVGGLVAAGLGVTVVVVVAMAKDWTPILAPWTVVGAPVIGAVTGVAAGLFPAIRASGVEPVDALRH